MGLALKIAVRFLLSGKGQTALIVGGIAIAISVQVFVGLLIDSLQAGLVDQTVGNSPQVTIRSSEENVTISRWEEMVTAVDALSSVRNVGVSASANAFVSKGNDSVPVLCRGLSPTAIDEIYGISAEIYEGGNIQATGEVLIGRTLSEKLGLSVDDRLQMGTPAGTLVEYRVVGLYDLGVAAIDGSWVVTNLRTAQSLFGFGDRITSIEVTVNDVFQADIVAADVIGLLNSDGLEVTDWKSENGQLLSALQSQSMSNTIIQAVIIVSVAIAIASLLSVNVLQKRRQLGILKAMGIKDGTASLIFVFQGLLIGFLASVAGIVLGLGLLYSFTVFATPGGESIIEFVVPPVFVLRSLAISIFAAALAGLVPASRSLRLNPIDVIREG
ncbi:MAG: ABC transporter permease [Dehalococcoidia bacterium]|nr:ABC transporter permease [Dehalococcoidia bacterium]